MILYAKHLFVNILRMPWIRVSSAEKAIVESARVAMIRERIWHLSVSRDFDGFLKRLKFLNNEGLKAQRDGLDAVTEYCKLVNSKVTLSLNNEDLGLLRKDLTMTKQFLVTDECKKVLFWDPFK